MEYVQYNEQKEGRDELMSKTVAIRFSEIMGARHLKISEVSRATGISRTTLTNLYYEKCGTVSFDVLSKLCTLLECNIGDLLQLPK